MDKLIKDIEDIISKYCFTEDRKFRLRSNEDFFRAYGQDDVVWHLSELLDSYKDRHSRASKSSSMEISSDQMHQINLLVDDARDRWLMLPDDVPFDDLSGYDAYRHGFVNAVCRFMFILGIDEKRVKK